MFSTPKNINSNQKSKLQLPSSYEKTKKNTMNKKKPSIPTTASMAFADGSETITADDVATQMTLTTGLATKKDAADRSLTINVLSDAATNSNRKKEAKSKKPPKVQRKEASPEVKKRVQGSGYVVEKKVS